MSLRKKFFGLETIEIITENLKTIDLSRGARKVGVLTTITGLASLTGCFLQDAATTRQALTDSPKVIRFVQVHDSQTGLTNFVSCNPSAASPAKASEQCSYIDGAHINSAPSVIGTEKAVSSEKVQKLNLKEYVRASAALKKDMTTSQEQIQTKAAIEFAQGAGMKMDHAFASAKRIVPFSFSANGLGPVGKQVVKEIAITAQDADRVYVRGRTDSSGTKEKNAILAKSRADSVRTMLAANGVQRNKMHATYCTTCYIATNDTENGRRLNRRVDIELIMPAAKVAALPKEKYEVVQLETSPSLDLQKEMQIANQPVVIGHAKSS